MVKRNEHVLAYNEDLVEYAMLDLNKTKSSRQ